MNICFRTAKSLWASTILLVAGASSALAADPIAADVPEVKLTKPVGGSILPGGQIYQSDIKSGFLFSKLIPFVLRYLIGLAAALSVIAIMFGGYLYLTAYGSEEQQKKATKTITWAVLGLVLCITAYAIVAVVARIQFTATPS